MGCDCSKHLDALPEISVGLPWVPENANTIGVPSEEVLNNLIDSYKEHNFERLRYQFFHDKPTFILNQLILSIQFFDNFDKVTKQAEEFKIETEKRLNRILDEERSDGVDRKILLMSGMGHVLAKYFVYQTKSGEKNGSQAQLDDFDEPERHLNGHRLNPTSFKCEGILPLDFLINYENFDVHLEDAVKAVEENHYASTMSEPPSFKITAEEGRKKNVRIPKGYVRLLPDDQQTHRASITKLVQPELNDNYDYSMATEANFPDRISEAVSSYASSLISEDDTESMKNMREGDKLLHRLEKRLTFPVVSQVHVGRSRPERPLDNGSGAQNSDSSEADGRLDNFKVEGVLPRNYPSAYTKHASQSPNLPGIHESDKPPEIRIDSAPPKPTTPTRVSPRSLSNDLLQPRWSPSARPRAPPPIPLELPQQKEDLPNFPHGRSPFTSDLGYDSMSASSSVSGLTEMAAGASMRRKPQLRWLWQYKRGNRQIITTSDGTHQLAPNCLVTVTKVKDRLALSDSDDDDDDDDNSWDSDEGAEVTTDPVFQKPEIITFLSSAGFSDAFLSDFYELGLKLALPHKAMLEAQVQGTTVRCGVELSGEAPPRRGAEEGHFRLLHTYTPTFQCKQWRQRVQFIHRLKPLTYSAHEDSPRYAWLSNAQVDSIVDRGFRVVPSGFQRPDFFNPDQAKEWLMTFPDAECLLLNTFRHSHWRVYIFAALLFRAFVFPRGPLGVGLDHVRNILYQLCELDFILWDEEQLGVKLEAVLKRLDESLSQPELTSFFSGQNMLGSTAREKTLIAKKDLKNVRDNLIVHILYSLDHLVHLQPKETFYPFPKLKKLYNILTVKTDQDLLRVQNPKLARVADGPGSMSPEPPEVRQSENGRGTTEPIQNMLRANFGLQSPEGDKRQIKLRKKLEQLLNNQRSREQSRARSAAARLQTEPVLPENESSIDITVFPVSKFSNLRLVMILKYFIKHFIAMAERGIELEAFAEATAYVLHVDNLCRLSLAIPQQGTNLLIWDIQIYQRRVKELREQIGSKAFEYIRSKFPVYLEVPDGSSLGLLNNSGADAPSMDQNFQLRRSSRPLPKTPLDVPSIRRIGDRIGHSYQPQQQFRLGADQDQGYNTTELMGTDLHADYLLPEDTYEPPALDKETPRTKANHDHHHNQPTHSPDSRSNSRQSSAPSILEFPTPGPSSEMLFY